MYKVTAVILGACLYSTGCETQPGVETSPAEANDIGVAQVEISHLVGVGIDETVVIRGLDASGSEIAAARLRTGLVSYEGEQGSVPSVGRELQLSAGSFVHPPIVNPALYPMTLPATVIDEAELRSFVRLQAVADALRDEGELSFTPTGAADEAAYLMGGGGTACSGRHFATNKPDPLQCCQDTSGSPVRAVVSSGLVDRLVYPNPCRNADQTIGCTSNCAIGPCRMYTAWSYPQGKVWKPFAGDGWNPNTCAFDNLAGYFYPYMWAGELLWSAPAASCSCTGCNADGTPSPAGCAN